MVIIATYIGLITQNSISGKTIFTHYGCKRCGYEGRLHRHGTYSRNVITFFQVFRIDIQRFQCPICKKTCSFLPSFLIPYFQYSLEFVMAILYWVYAASLSPSRIPVLINSIGQHCHISLQSVLFYMKRFNLHKFRLNSFFAAIEQFHHDSDILFLEDAAALKVLVRKFFVYHTLFGHLSIEYHKAFRCHFMSCT